MKQTVIERLKELEEVIEDLAQKIESETSRYDRAKMTTQLRFARELKMLNEGILRGLK